MARLILIADDSPVIQRMAQRILQDEGFEVQTVSNGVAAIKKLPGVQPVLVLADVSMPGKDGYEVCEFVKTSPDLRHVPVLLVGSDLEPYDEQLGARVRADGIIKKPFSPHDLIAAVRRFTALAKAPTSPPPPEETPVAAPLAPAKADSTESQAASEIAGEGKAVETPSDGMAAASGVADDVMSRLAQQPHENQVDATGILPELSAVPTEPFPGFVLQSAPESGLEPSHESEPGPAHAAPETSGGIPSPAEIAQFVLPPQLVDLTAPEDVPEPHPAFPGPVAEPIIAPGPELTAAEAARGLEESKAQQLGELSRSPQLVDLETLEATLKPALSITEPTPQPFPVLLPEPAAPDVEWVQKVVHKVVARMAPPVLSPEQVEELARMLTREIASELGGAGRQMDFPQKPPPGH